MLDSTRPSGKASTVGMMVLGAWLGLTCPGIQASEPLTAVEDDSDATYDDVVAEGVATARSGQIEEAERILSLAIRMAPERPEAYRERGALYFLVKRYDDSVGDLKRASDYEADVETRRLLGAALHLADRPKAALAVWNTMNEPRLRMLHFSGLARTRPLLVREEVLLQEGQLLSVSRLEETELRLKELSAFSRVTLRPVPLGDGSADLEVALVERHGLAGSPVEWTFKTLTQLLARRIEIEYYNLLGAGVSLRNRYRWRTTQPDFSTSCDWPRPFGLDVKAGVRVFRGRQSYELDEPIVRHSRGIDLKVSHVIDGRTLLRLGLGYRNRHFRVTDALAQPGEYLSLRLGFSRRLFESSVCQLTWDGSLVGSEGSRIKFMQGVSMVNGRVRMSNRASQHPSTLAFQVKWGLSSRQTPFDELMIPGGGYEAEWPLRAHHRDRDGLLGQSPLSQGLWLSNIEWRQGIAAAYGVHMSISVAYDVAIAVGSILGGGGRRHFQDISLGLRFKGVLGLNVRGDIGLGLLDGRKAVFLGLDEWF